MITKEQAMTCNTFHYGECVRHVGPRGGVKVSTREVRRSGQTQTWKRTPERFRVPVKYGFYLSYEITQDNASDWHTVENCPLNIKE